MNTLDELKKWLGIKDTLKLANREYRGIYTTKPIEKNKIIIKIESKYLLEYQKIYSIFPIDNICEANSLVAFYLTKLYLDKDEFWSNYIKTMPEDLSQFPYFWNIKELNYLKNTSFYSSIITNYPSHLETIQEDFNQIYQYNLENSIISNIDENELWNIYLKFRILVGSRIFGYTKYGEETSGLVPYIDLLNHSSEPNTIWYWDDNLNAFILASTKNIEKGEELTDNYGEKNNVELLLYYGFTMCSNSSSILSFCSNGIDYLFDLLFDVSKLENINKTNKELLVKKLKNIHSSHIKNLLCVTNPNIINIYTDEIKIIKILLNNLQT